MMYGSIEDFQPVADELIAVLIATHSIMTRQRLMILQQNMEPPYDWDAYATPFMAQAANVVSAADKAKDQGEKAKASELYL